MKTTQITTAVASLALTALALTGCVVENAPAGAKGPKTPATSAPSAEPEVPVEDDEGTEDSSPDEPTGATADLGVEDGQVQYFRAIQNFSPTLERWVVDEDAEEVTYSLINCASQAESKGVANLEPADRGEGTTYEATWLGKSPLKNVAAESVRLEITDDTLTNFSDVATSRTEIEAGNFSRMCVDAGETAAAFVF